MIKLIYVLAKIKLLSPIGLYRLFSSINRYGINLMSLLSFAEKVYADKTVLVDDNESLSYKQLFSQSKKLSLVLRDNYQLNSSHKVGFICKNHASLVKAIFAASQLGADIYLLNPEMSKNQIAYLIDIHNFDLFIYDSESSSLIEQTAFNKAKILSYHEHLPAINNLLRRNVNEKEKLIRTSNSKLALLTGGTTGNSKIAAHKPSLLSYLNPFITVITRLKLMKYNTAYIATPIYHGYGVAILLLFIAMGKKVIITNRFESKKACSLIRKHNVEVISVVPLMIAKMLKHDTSDLRSLSCIVSGGAKLNPKLVQKTTNLLGDVLYNLYGTSESGLNIIATPQDLNYSANTVGKKISGSKLNILDENKKEVDVGKIGQLCIKNSWSMRNTNSSLIETGDLGYRDKKGYYFLAGRLDDMVVSAGENVYPVEIEQILITHPKIEDVAIIGIDDEIFGQRLKAFVQPVQNENLTEVELVEWLRSRIARYQMPKEITFVNEMPYTHLGKINKKQLKKLANI